MPMANHIKSLTGIRFGRLVAVHLAGRTLDGKAVWNCICDCGKAKLVRSSCLLRTKGGVRSCGCLLKENYKNFPSGCSTTNGEQRNGEKSPEYAAYHNAKSRCENLNDPYYGGRGIEFKFRSFEEFLKDIGRRPEGKCRVRSLYSIDRIDNDGHYEPGNVKWSTGPEQQANTRKAKK